eukprot:365674-Chlamydomonas_euryale.AAC.15
MHAGCLARRRAKPHEGMVAGLRNILRVQGIQSNIRHKAMRSRGERVPFGCDPKATRLGGRCPQSSLRHHMTARSKAGGGAGRIDGCTENDERSRHTFLSASNNARNRSMRRLNGTACGAVRSSAPRLAGRLPAPPPLPPSSERTSSTSPTPAGRIACTTAAALNASTCASPVRVASSRARPLPPPPPPPLPKSIGRRRAPCRCAQLARRPPHPQTSRSTAQATAAAGRSRAARRARTGRAAAAARTLPAAAAQHACCPARQAPPAAPTAADAKQTFREEPAQIPLQPPQRQAAN